MQEFKSNRFKKALALILVLTMLSAFFVLQVSAADKGAWAPNTAYATGDVVTYNGSTYTCLQSHTSLAGWEPSNVPALWKLGGSSGGGTVAAPSFSPAGGTYTSTQSVTLACATSGATIRYTTDGTTPTASSAAYTTAISVTATTTIKAIATKSGMTDSAVASATYTINSTPSQVAAPTFSPAGGTFTSAQSVTLACATSGATIRYTTDGTAPTASSPVYSAAISVASTTTIKAIATKSGMTDSAVATATYTINSTPTQVAAPTFSPAGGTYYSAQSVTLACATAGSTIRYTTDGTAPTTASPVYSAAINVATTTTIKAIATKSGMTDSAVATATYTISTQPPINLPGKLIVGYWHNFDNGTGAIKLKDVSTKWNVINVAFADITPDSTVSFTPFNATDAEFKSDIAYLNSLGTKVVLSLGGQNGALNLSDSASKTRFTNSLIATVDKFGFNGVDLDIETGISLGAGDSDFKNPKTATIVNLIAGMKDVCAKYGSNFILSMAPEVAYVQGGITAFAGPWGGYLPIIYGLRSELTYIHVQHYNCGGNAALDGKTYNQGTADFEVAMADMLLSGFPIGGNSSNMFPALRPDQVAIGLPASSGAAPSGGYINPTEMKKALDYIIKGVSFGGSYKLQNSSGYSGFRGIMTWSINWDVSTGNAFINNYRPYFDALK